MAIVVKASTLGAVRFPLICDPAIQAANPQPKDAKAAWALAVYSETSDYRHPAAPLVIPPDACWVTVRPLSRRELLTVDGIAGEHSAADSAVYADVLDEVGRYHREGKTRADDRARAALSPEKQAAYERYCEWLARRTKELVRASLISISDLPSLVRGPDGFPVEALVQMDDPAPDSALAWPPGLHSEVVLQEIARLVIAVSMLGKAPSHSSDTPSGSTTTTRTDGSAKDRAGVTGTSRATKAGRSRR